MPSPDIEHLPGLAASILRDIAVDRNIDPRWLAPLAGDELEIVAKVWSASERSVRKLQKIINATVTAREECAARH